MQGGDTGDEFE
jgi:hypothetical protein